MKSKAQRAYLWMHHPEIAKRWEKITPHGKKLPEHVKKAVEKIAKTLKPNAYIKTAEPPPPKNVSVEEWDKILQRGPPQKKKTSNTSKEISMNNTLQNNVKKIAADLIAGGQAEGLSPQNFNAQQLAAGQKIEMEHTNNPAVAREIAEDHLTEFPNYYPALKKMEKHLEIEKESAYYLKGIKQAFMQLGL